MEDVRARGHSRPSTRLDPSGILIRGEELQYLSEGLSLGCSGTSSLALELRDSLLLSLCCILEREDILDLAPASSFSFLGVLGIMGSSFFLEKEEWRLRLLVGDPSDFLGVLLCRGVEFRGSVDDLAIVAGGGGMVLGFNCLLRDALCVGVHVCMHVQYEE